MKERTVLMEVQVPDSPYCILQSLDIRCKHFKITCAIGRKCSLGFHPEVTKNGSYKKPKKCLELKWKENIK